MVKRLVFKEMDVNAFDFSTQYVPDRLKSNLTTNVKQAMMNQMVVEMMTSSGNTHSQIEVSAPGIGLYPGKDMRDLE